MLHIIHDVSDQKYYHLDCLSDYRRSIWTPLCYECT